MSPLVLPQSGQLVRVHDTREGDFGIYLHPGATPVYVYFDRGEGGWRLYHYHPTDGWRFAPLEPVVQPERLGEYLVWRLPSQVGIPDIEIGWRSRIGTWVVSAHLPVTGLGLTRRDPLPWGSVG